MRTDGGAETGCYRLSHVSGSRLWAPTMRVAPQAQGPHHEGSKHAPPQTFTPGRPEVIPYPPYVSALYGDTCAL